MANSMLSNLRLAGLLTMSIATLIVLLSAFAVEANEPGVISASEATAKSADGDLLIIDVRTPAEWRETGTPRGAARANIFDHDFIEQIARIVGSDKSRLIAMICARGNRSTRAKQMLAEAGFSNVQNVREGMLGSAYGRGWLASGYPTQSCALC